MEKKCEDRIKDEWKSRQQDLQDPEFDALGFDYVAPHTWENRLEYWFLDWFDGAKLLLSQKDQAWTQMQEMLSA